MVTNRINPLQHAGEHCNHNERVYLKLQAKSDEIQAESYLVLQNLYLANVLSKKLRQSSGPL